MIARAAEASLLDRLGIPMAEAILAHADDGVTAPTKLPKDFPLVGSQACHVGVSHFSRERLVATQAALGHSSSVTIEFVQEEFSLAERSGIDELPGCADINRPLGVICSAALARGFLLESFSTRWGGLALDRHSSTNTIGSERTMNCSTEFVELPMNTKSHPPRSRSDGCSSMIRSSCHSLA